MKTVTTKNRRETIRTILVLFGGVMVSILASALFENILAPNSADLISRLYTQIQPHDPAVFFRGLSHSIAVTIYVINPLVGLIVGAFVGLLQRIWTKTVAACCLMPNFIVVSSDDHRRLWAYSIKGITVFAFHNALPFAAAIITATFIRYVLTGRRVEEPISG